MSCDVIKRIKATWCHYIKKTFLFGQTWSNFTLNQDNQDKNCQWNQLVVELWQTLIWGRRCKPFDFKIDNHVLFILTSKRVLHMPFSGWNHLLMLKQLFPSFSCSVATLHAPHSHSFPFSWDHKCLKNASRVIPKQW